MSREYDLEDILAEYSDDGIPDDGNIPEEETPPLEDTGLTQVFRAPEAQNSPLKTVSVQEAEEEKKKEKERVEELPKKKTKKKRKKKESFAAKLGFSLLSLIFAVVSVGVLAWSLLNLHPDTTVGSSEGSRPQGSINLVSRLDDGLNNS